MKKINLFDNLFNHRLSGDDHSLLNDSYNNIVLLRQKYDELSRDNEELKKVWYNAKTNGSKVTINGGEEKEWGYWVNQDFGYVCIYTKRLNIDKIVDLGCGAGFGLKVINELCPSIKTFGYDNEQVLLDIANEGKKENEKYLLKDIIKLKKKDIPKDSLIYFWEPIKDRDLCKDFIENLCKIARKGQIICVKCSGSSVEHLRNNSLVREGRRCEITGLYFFIKK